VPPGAEVAEVVVGATLDEVLVSEEELLDGLLELLPPHPTAKDRSAEPPSIAAAVLSWYGMGLSLSSRIVRTHPVPCLDTRGTSNQTDCDERARLVADCYTGLQIATHGGGTCPMQPTGSLASLLT
jgi:hypothetical protein